jgi:hypothetical protein
MTRDLERAAVKYAVNGYRVFPVKPGSNAPPLVKGFQRSATKDPARAAEIWREYPDANPGIATGRGLVIVDCDTRRAIDQARRELGVPEATPTLKTPRGGLHFYLAGHAPNHRASTLLRGEKTTHTGCSEHNCAQESGKGGRAGCLTP